MEISTNVVSGVLILAITGGMDSNDAQKLEVACHDFPDIPVVLDLLHVEYINAARSGGCDFNRGLGHTEPASFSWRARTGLPTGS